MKILIATGIFSPETGGPATLAPVITSKLMEMGHTVTLITYSDATAEPSDEEYTFEVIRIVRGNKISNYWRYFKTVLTQLSSCDLVYTLDWFSAGIPVSVACRLKNKKYIVRIGGDYGWERYLDWGKNPLSIREFYERGIYKEGRIKIFFVLIKWVLNGAQKVIFNSDVQRELYEKYYELEENETVTIYNPIPQIEVKEKKEAKKEILFAGRLVVKNNVSLLIDAFTQAHLDGFKLIIIGNGEQKSLLENKVSQYGIEDHVEFIPRMPHEKLLGRIRDAYCLVLPSWTDVSPNTAYEALLFHTPFLITQENYLPFRDNIPMQFSPYSVEELRIALKALEQPDEYHRYKQRIANIDTAQSVGDFISKHITLFTHICGS